MRAMTIVFNISFPVIGFIFRPSYKLRRSLTLLAKLVVLIGTVF